MKTANSLLKTALMTALVLTLLTGLSSTSYAQNTGQKKETVDKKKVIEKKAVESTGAEAKNKIIIKKSDAAEAGDDVEVNVEVVNGKVFVNGKEVADVDMDGGVYRVGRMDDAMPGMNRFMFKGDGGNMEFEFDTEKMAEAMEGRMADMMAQEEDMARMRGRMMTMPDRVNGYAPFAVGLSSMENAEVMKMEMKSRELAMKIRREDGDVGAMEKELNDLLTQIFDKKQELRRAQIDKVRGELEKLEKTTMERNQNRAEIIARHQKELLGQSSSMDW